MAVKTGTPVRLLNTDTREVEAATYYGIADDSDVFLFRKSGRFARKSRDGKVVEINNPERRYVVLEEDQAA